MPPSSSVWLNPGQTILSPLPVPACGLRAAAEPDADPEEGSHPEPEKKPNAAHRLIFFTMHRANGHWSADASSHCPPKMVVVVTVKVVDVFVSVTVVGSVVVVTVVPVVVVDVVVFLQALNPSRHLPALLYISQETTSNCDEGSTIFLHGPLPRPHSVALQ